MRALGLLLVLALPLGADTLHLKSGGKIEGKIVGEEGGRWKVKLATGEITVAKEDVARIEYGPSPEEELQTRRKAIDPKDAKAVVELAKWAHSKGFSDDAIAIARSCDAPDARALVLQLIEPEVARRLDQAKKLLKLGLVRRAKGIIDGLVESHPEVKERANAILPEPPKRRTRYEGVEIADAERFARVEKAVNAFFADGTPVRGIDAPLAEFLVAIRRGARGAGNPGKGVHKCRTKDGVEYLLRVPDGYDPEVPMPLLFSMHGSEGTGAIQWACWAGSMHGDKDFVAAFPDGGTIAWGHARVCHERAFSVIGDAMSRVTIDPDRLCVDGASFGAHGSFTLAMYHTDRIAAIAPRAGSARLGNYGFKVGLPDMSPAPATLANLWNTPVFLIAGAKDNRTPIEEVRQTQRKLEALGAPLVYREYEDGGHEWFGGEDGDVLDFLRHHRRDPYPKRVRLVARELAFGRCSWIEILSATRDPRVQVEHVDLKGKVLEVRKEFDKPVEIDAEADRAKNRITIKAQGARELRVWLSDELVDLDKPVEIVVNGDKAFSGKVERSLQAALDDCRKRGDRGNPFVANVKVAIR